MNFTYKSQKADSFYYQCNHCKSYVTMIFLNGKFQLKNEHSCEVNLEKKKISEVHFMKSELLSKAEKILSDDPSLGPQGLYHEVLKINRKMDQNSIYITKGEVKKITEDFKQKNYSGFPDEIVNITIELNGRVTHRYLFLGMSESPKGFKNFAQNENRWAIFVTCDMKGGGVEIVNS